MIKCFKSLLKKMLRTLVSTLWSHFCSFAFSPEASSRIPDNCVLQEPQ